ncbi:MAG: type II toxin-antitoxin system VapC family toxin [Nitrospirae bacterium]|nr:type II toxin-antitoxin system VapC family toxin [Nitrospirota bacterium]
MKLYIEEAGSERIREIVFSESNNVFISKITAAEVAAAFSRRQRMKDITEENYGEVFANFLLDYERLFARSEVTDSVIAIAIELTRKQFLRGYDSVQLSSAITLNTEINERLTFISADVELNNAAKTEGLAVEYL